MAIAQMNWGRLRHALDHPDMATFNAALSGVYALAEQHPGFIWRIPDDDAARQLGQLGHDNRLLATVSVWDTVEALHDFTFSHDHGAYFDQRAKWFEPVAPPQLVLWDTLPTARPTFEEAFRRLERLKTEGPSPSAYQWPKHLAR